MAMSASTVSARRLGTSSSAPYVVGPVSDVSSSLSGSNAGKNAEVEQAADPKGRYVYEAWIAFSGNRNTVPGIAFARSDDGGKHFATPIWVYDSQAGAAWDPAITVAPTGTVYVSYMVGLNGYQNPVVEASFDHGRTFPQVSSLVPSQNDYVQFGDRDFIAAGSHGVVYVTWDYGPDRKNVSAGCPPGGSCYYDNGELNVVIQKSTDGGKTWGPMVHVSPGFPASGADSGPVVLEPNGRVDVLYQGYHVSTDGLYTLTNAHSYFTSSTDGGETWSTPVRIGPAGPTMSHTDWWINGDISIDRGGDLYATWDTQNERTDTGWLSYSSNHGKTWSKLQRVTMDTDYGLNIVEVAGGTRGVAFVGWLSGSSPRGYAQYVREYVIGKGWQTKPIQVSRQFGNPSIWPGDTIGISALPGPGKPRCELSWGSAVGNANGEIYAAQATFGKS
jgi:hypothetical protein